MIPDHEMAQQKHTFRVTSFKQHVLLAGVRCARACVCGGHVSVCVFHVATSTVCS
jgi:hypothetical protein